jgi:tetratricopeptide (TPR) repeat protein
VPQAVDLGAWLESTNAGEATVAYLAATARELARAYTNRPPLTVLKDATELQRRITALLRGGRQRLAQTRDLCQTAAEVFVVLALLCSDVGQYPSAEAYGHAGWICAEEAGSGLGSAFVLSAQAKTAQWQKRYADAMARACRGYEICPPAGARVLLACQEANAAQALGDHARARQALSRARAAQDAATSSTDDDGTTAWSCPPPREANYAAIVNLGCGDLKRSLQEARRADKAWSEGDPWVYGTWAQVRIGAAFAHVRDGETGGAAEEIAPVLSIPSEYRVVTITDRLGYVGQLLHGQRYRGSHAAADLGEQIGEFQASSLRVKAISAPGGL